MTLPGTNTTTLQAPCIAISIKTKGLPPSLIKRERNVSGQIVARQSVAVDWKAAKAWEILQVVRPAAVQEKGGTLLLLYLEN